MRTTFILLLSSYFFGLAILGIGCEKSDRQDGDRSPQSEVTAESPCDVSVGQALIQVSVVRISTDLGTEGTGIVVGRDRIVANGILVANTQRLTVFGATGPLSGTVRGVDDATNIALIDSPVPQESAVRWADVDVLPEGEPLYGLGFTFDSNDPVADTHPNLGLIEKNGIGYVAIDGLQRNDAGAASNPGIIGGPVFTACGKAVGLRTFNTAIGFGLVISPSSIETALSRIDAGSPVASDETPLALSTDKTRDAKCGTDAEVELAEQPAFGRSYHDDEKLSVTISYDAPGCTSARAWFTGISSSESPWIQHWCAQGIGSCEARWTTIGIGSNEISLAADRGEITFEGLPGAFPPIDLAAAPNLEGFRLCVVEFRFDNPDEERANYYDEIGIQC